MKILEPFKIRGLILKNRIIMSSMCTNFGSPEGFVTDRLKQYYVARARGGVGLIITGNAYIDIGGKVQPNQLGIDDEDKVPKLRELSDAIHSAGGRIAVQLNHGGRNSLVSITGRKPEAPSPIPSFRYVDGDAPLELDYEGIHRLIEIHRRASLLSKESGFDAIELEAGHGYLIHQFLSKYTNRRSDLYGGSLENRARFLREVLQAVRRGVGETFPIFVRISAEEFIPGGEAVNEAKYVAKVIEEEGGDVIDVSMGQSPSSPEDRDYQMTRHQNVPPMDFPPACWVGYASKIKEVVQLPIMTIGRINDPELGEKILQEGHADLIGMGRALIADPDLPRKLAEGKSQEIRKCIACNQGCADRVFQLMDIECLVNAQVGYETERAITPAAKKKRVLVVGGGPGGMEAARVASLRGHEVTLIERSDELGGQLRLAAVVPFREVFWEYIAYQKLMLNHLSVNVVIGQEVDVDMIRSMGPDAVILATGGRPKHLSIPGVGKGNVVNAWDILSGKAKATGPAVVIGGGAVGLETAEFMLKSGIQVTVVEMLNRVGTDFYPGILALILDRLKKGKANVLTRTKAVEVKTNGIEVEGEKGRWVLPAAMIVQAVGVDPNDELLRGLDKHHIPPAISIGDCKTPRKAYQAVHEGYLAALEI